MNLLFFIETGCGNGRSMADQAIELNKIPDLTLYTISSSYDQERGVAQSVQNEGIENLCLRNLEKHENFVDHRKELRRYINEKNVDIVHVQSNWELLLVITAIFGLRRKPKVIYTIHAFRNNENIVKRFVARVLITIELLLFADKVITCSRFMYDSFKILNYKSEILPLGVEKQYIERAFEDIPRAINIIFPGMFRKGKGQDSLIRAFANFLKETKDVNSRLYLPGDGELLKSCKMLAEKLDIIDRVAFPGKLNKEELLKLYDQCNIVACTSKSETFSQILAEGFCLGKCLISRPVGIAQDIIVEDANGYIINNEKQLKNVLVFLSQNSSLISRIGMENYGNRGIFSWNKIANSYAEICKRLQ